MSRSTDCQKTSSVSTEIDRLWTQFNNGGDFAILRESMRNLIRRSPFAEDHLRSIGDDDNIEKLFEVTRSIFNAGHRVIHENRPDCGVGQIISVHGAHCTAHFSTDKFSGIPISAIISVEDREQRAEECRRRSENIRDALRKLFDSDFLNSDTYFHQLQSDEFLLKDFFDAKSDFVQQWLLERCQKAIDDEQAACICLTGPDCQVVARAGSGKTSTLVNRAFFLQKHCGVKPSEMMLLAFNKKAAEEMEERLKKLLDDQPPFVMTFHALAHALVHPEQNLIHDSSDGRNQALSRFVQDVIDARLSNPDFVERIRKVMMAHFQEDWDRIEEGGYDLPQAEMLEYRRSLQRETLRGEFVKSYGEKVVANFLFEHQVPYLYEPAERGGRLKNYHPDFLITRGDRTGVAIEYFGMTGDPDYDEMSAEKRQHWANKPGWILIELTPTNINPRGLASLQAELERAGFACNRMTELEIWQQVQKRAIDRFSMVTRSFIARCRKRELTPEALRQEIARHKTKWQVEADFLDIMVPIYRDYLERLEAVGNEDFDGLMQRAAQVIDAGKTTFSRNKGKQNGDLAKLRFMLIDEYQDFSKLFHSLVDATRQQNPGLQLFCVGDDWQAINGFAGSDLTYYEKFQDYFPDAKRLYISTNYRSAAGIVAAGNAVMAGQQNPSVAHSKQPGTVLLANMSDFTSSPNEGVRHGDDLLTPMVLRLTAHALSQGKNIVLLSRNNGLRARINYKAYQGTESKSSATGIERFRNLIRSYFPEGQRHKIRTSTTHGFKGLQSDVVVVLDAVTGCYPLIHQDWIFLRLLGESIGTITAEARRLFYVALTRAIDTLVIFTEKERRTPFLDDVERQMSLTKILWGGYPVVSASSDRLKVYVGNQAYRGGKPTVDIKEFLKQEGYGLSKLNGNWFSWMKTFPVVGFNIDELMHSTWSTRADGVEVRILNEQDNLVGNYKIDQGVWAETIPLALST